MLQVISSGMVQRLKCELENSAFQAGKRFKMYAYDTIKKKYLMTFALVSILDVLLKVHNKHEKCRR